MSASKPCNQQRGNHSPTWPFLTNLVHSSASCMLHTITFTDMHTDTHGKLSLSQSLQTPHHSPHHTCVQCVYRTYVSVCVVRTHDTRALSLPLSLSLSLSLQTHHTTSPHHTRVQCVRTCVSVFVCMCEVWVCV